MTKSYFFKKNLTNVIIFIQNWEIPEDWQWSHLKGHVQKWGRKILKVDFSSIGSPTRRLQATCS